MSMRQSVAVALRKMELRERMPPSVSRILTIIISLSLSRTPFLRFVLLHLGWEEDFGALGGKGIKYAHSNEV